MKNLAFAFGGALIGLLIGLSLFFVGTSSNLKPVPTVLVPSSGAHPDLSITASASFVSAQIKQTLRTNGLAKSSTATFAAPNLIRVNASTEFSILGFSITVNTTTTMRVTVQNGRLVLKTENVGTGGLPVPQATLDSLIERARLLAEDQMNLVVQSSLRGTNLRVTNIRMTETDVTVELSE